MMDRSTVFWTAFWTGMAAPVCVFAAPATYDDLLPNVSPAQNFSIVGSYLSSAAQKYKEEQKTVG